MSSSLRHQGIIVAVATVVLFLNVGTARLWDQDEAFFTQTAVEMHERGDWVVPYFNGEPFAHKPPLMYWMMRVGFMMFGVNELAARFWPAVFGVASALLVYHLGRRMVNSQVGLWAGLAIATALNFDLVCRAATADSFLIFFCTLSLYLFARREQWQTVDASATTSDAAPKVDAALAMRWSDWAAVYAAMGLAVLTKGPIGVLLPGCVLGLYLLLRNPMPPLADEAGRGERALAVLRRFTPQRIASTLWTMRPLTAIAMVLAVAGPWFALVEWRTGGGFFSEFFGVHNLGRFLKSMDNHSGPIWYYIPAVLVGFFPWSIFGIPTAIEVARGCRTDRTTGQPSSRAARFLAAWVCVYIGFFSLASTKLPSYILPVYPALALSTAIFIRRWTAQPQAVHRWWPRLSFGSLAVVGVGLMLAGPIGASLLDSPSAGKKPFASPELGEPLQDLVWLGAILLVGGVGGIALAQWNRASQALAGLMATAVAFSLGLFAVIALEIDRQQPSPELAAAIDASATSEPIIAQYNCFRPSMVYYSGTRVESCKSLEEAAEFLRQSPNAFLVMPEEHYPRLAARLPAGRAILDRRAEFPKAGTVVVIGPAMSTARRDESSVR